MTRKFRNPEARSTDVFRCYAKAMLMGRVAYTKTTHQQLLQFFIIIQER